MQSRSYKAKDGTNRQVLEVVADQLYFTGDKRTATPAQQYASQQAAPTQQYAPQQATPTQQYAQYVQQTAQQQPQQFGVEEINLSDDDLPF